jgi:hypothetical protein
MSQTINIYDDLHSRLQAKANLRGVSIENLIEEWETIPTYKQSLLNIFIMPLTESCGIFQVQPKQA